MLIERKGGEKMYTFGDYLNMNDDACAVCARKVGKNSWFVHLSISGNILHPASDADAGQVSQGFWPVGSECAKKFDAGVLVKN